MITFFPSLLRTYGKRRGLGYQSVNSKDQPNRSKETFFLPFEEKYLETRNCLFIICLYVCLVFTSFSTHLQKIKIKMYIQTYSNFIGRHFLSVCNDNPLTPPPTVQPHIAQTNMVFMLKKLWITNPWKTKKESRLLSLKLLKCFANHFPSVDWWLPYFRILSTAGSHSTADVNIKGKGSWNELLL